MFKDHFSDRSSEYARFRPGYPAALFEWLASVVPDAGTVWDCATGSGQAAASLAPLFRRVIATDGSARQLANATPADNVEYRVALAEDCGIASNSVDLVTVAQALHWFDLERFYAEVRRVSRAGAIVAAWTYTAADTQGEIGALIRHYHDDVVGSYWPPERAFVEARYQTLDFPFTELTPPSLQVRLRVNIEQLTGYFGTWSATRAYRRQTGEEPLATFARDLTRIWPAGQSAVELRIPLTLRAGRVT